MRKAIYRSSDEDARALLARAAVVHLATVDAAGMPVYRNVHAIFDGDALLFHGAPAGERMESLGKPVVACAEEVVASIPSYFIDPERACPATTYCLSAQAHGTIMEVTDPERRTRALAALSGHTPIAHDHPLYKKAIEGPLVAEVRIVRIDGKAKLGQDLNPTDRVRVLEALWQRGAEGDVEAIATILERSPDLPLPVFLRSPEGSCIAMDCAVGDDAFDEALALLEGAYWLASVPVAKTRAAIAASTARIGARDAEGRLVGFARALSDGRAAWIYDVVVAPHARRAGVGNALMKLLLDHPAVRGALKVRLGTRDAMAFYERLGFESVFVAETSFGPSTEMVRKFR